MRLKHISIIGLALIGLVSCDLMTSYRFDTTGNHLADVRVSDYLKMQSDTSLSMCSEAFSYTGMYDLLDSGKDLTVLLPTNFAFRQFMDNIGVTRITDIDSRILRQLLMYCIIPGEQLSYNLPTEEITFETYSGNPIILVRSESEFDKYHIVINPPQSDPSFGAKQFSPRQQDMIFKDHVAHTTDNFPLFELKCQTPDIAPERPDAGVIKWKISGDTQFYGSGKPGFPYYQNKVGCAYRTNASQNRIGLMLFEKIDLPFNAEMITSARLNVFAWSNSTSSPTVTTLAIYDQSFIPNRPPVTELTKDNFRPIIDPQYQIGKVTNLLYREWSTGDITEFVRDFYTDDNKNEFFLGITPTPEQMHAAGGIELGWLDEDKPDDESGNPSYITIVGNIISELEITVREDFTCSLGGNVQIDDKILQSAGPQESEFTYTDNNIIYTIKQKPMHGAVTKNGIPMKTGEKFTQEEMNKGIVRYYHYGQNSSPDSITIQVSDYTLANVPDLVKLNITIN